MEYEVVGFRMHLSERTTTDYEHDGELGDRTRCEIRSDARILATTLGRPVDIYSSDGILLEQIAAEETCEVCCQPECLGCEEDQESEMYI